MYEVVVLAAVVEACPSTNGRHFPQAASEYAKLAGLLAGFAFTALVFILKERVSGRFARAVELLAFAFFGLILTSANYAIISGEAERYAAGRAVSEGVLAAGAFTVAGILVLFAILLLLDAVQRSNDDAAPDDNLETERDFARVKRHLSAITATVVTFTLVFIVVPGIRLYADVADRPAVELVAWGALAAQFILSCIIGAAYLLRHGRTRRPLTTDWGGTSRFAVASMGFILVSTLACQWAGTRQPCEQAPWPLIVAAVVINAVLMGYASLVIGGPWLRTNTAQRPMRASPVDAA